MKGVESGYILTPRLFSNNDSGLNRMGHSMHIQTCGDLPFDSATLRRREESMLPHAQHSRHTLSKDRPELGHPTRISQEQLYETINIDINHYCKQYTT